MRKQVGWYNPKSRGVCMKHDKELSPAYDRYTVPVFADDTVPVFTDETSRVPKYEKPRDENNEDDVVNETPASVHKELQDERHAFVSTSSSCPIKKCWFDEDDRLTDIIQVQILENQVAMMLAILSLRSEGLTNNQIRRNLVCMRKQSVELLERLKKK